MSQVSSAKKLLLITLCSLFILVGCGAKNNKVDYEGPTEGPDVIKMTPDSDPK